jgi:hypothetical protein
MVKIVPADDGRQKIFSGNRCVGYVENDVLYGFDKDGYAVEICRVVDGVSIGAMYIDWRRKNPL